MTNRRLLEVRDLFAAPFPQRKYVNATVIDVLHKTAASRKMANYERPYTGNGVLDKVCNEIYDETVLSAPKFVKAITLLNRRLAADRPGWRGPERADAG